MSDYLPDNLDSIEDALVRKQAVTLERASKLQPLQALFVNHLFECNMDIGVAAHRTGIKVPTARKWVEGAGPTSDLIGLRLGELAKQSKITVETIVQGLHAEATRMPKDVEDKTVSMAARVSAWSHLAKYKGMYDKGSKVGAQNILVNIDVSGDASISGGGNE